jgi:hypothetical protein
LGDVADPIAARREAIEVFLGYVSVLVPEVKTVPNEELRTRYYDSTANPTHVALEVALDGSIAMTESATVGTRPIEQPAVPQTREENSAWIRARYTRFAALFGAELLDEAAAIGK